MIVKFLGVKEKRTTGCPVCGNRSSDTVFRMSKSYILPSGATKLFRMGQEYDLNERDAQFLLSYKGVFERG